MNKTGIISVKKKIYILQQQTTFGVSFILKLNDKVSFYEKNKKIYRE